MIFCEHTILLLFYKPVFFLDMYSCKEYHYLQLLTVWYTSEILSFHRGLRSSGSIKIFACAALVFYGVLMEISFDRMGPHINLWGAFLSVIAIFSSKRHALENSRCSCFLNVEIMKAAYHWKLLSGQRWCPHRLPIFFEQPVQSVSEQPHRVSSSFILEKVSVVCCSWKCSCTFMRFQKQSC